MGKSIDLDRLKSLIQPILKIFGNVNNDNRCPIKLTLAAKCLILLSDRSDKSDSKFELFRKKIIIEGQVIKRISFYLRKYPFDEKLTLACLDLFAILMKEIELPLYEILYNGEERLFEILIGYLNETNVKGYFYSQRVS